MTIGQTMRRYPVRRLCVGRNPQRPFLRPRYAFEAPTTADEDTPKPVTQDV